MHRVEFISDSSTSVRSPSIENSRERQNSITRLLLRFHLRDDAGQGVDQRRRDALHAMLVAEQQVAARHLQAADFDRLAEVDDVREGVRDGDAAANSCKRTLSLTVATSRTDPFVA